MGKIGFLPVAAILLFGVAIPFLAYKASRIIGLKPMLALALAIGLGYGAIKAETPWSSHLAGNVALVIVSVIVLMAYTGLSVVAARMVAALFARLRP